MSILPVTLLSVCVAFASTETNAEAPDLLGLSVTDVEAADSEVSASEWDTIADLVGRKKAHCATAKVYSGEATVSGRGVAVTVVDLWLEPPFESIRLVALVDHGGAIADAALEGRPDLDEDPDRRWGHFLGLFTRTGQLVPKGDYTLYLDDAISTEEHKADRAEVGEDEARSAWDRAMRAQRVVMQRNALLQRFAFANPGSAPEVEWLLEQRDAVTELAASSGVFESTLGKDGMARYQAELRKLEHELRRAAEAADSGEDFSGFKDALSESCRDCHNKDLDWDDRFSAVREDRGYAPGMMDVGYDLAPALGDSDGALSQAIARAIRMSLLIGDAVLEE